MCHGLVMCDDRVVDVALALCGVVAVVGVVEQGFRGCVVDEVDACAVADRVVLGGGEGPIVVGWDGGVDGRHDLVFGERFEAEQARVGWHCAERLDVSAVRQ